MVLGFFRGGGKWVGVAEHTLSHPHVKFKHDINFHRLIFNEIFKKNSHMTSQSRYTIRILKCYRSRKTICNVKKYILRRLLSVVEII